MAWVRAWLCKLQKGCTRLAAASDKVYQLLVHGRWFSPGTPASSTTKTGCHDISDILLKVALNTINQINQLNGSWYPLRFPHKNGVRFVLYFQLFVGGLMSYLRYFRLLAYSGVLCVLFVYHVCLVYPVLPVSLDWPIVDCPFGIL